MGTINLVENIIKLSPIPELWTDYLDYKNYKQQMLLQELTRLSLSPFLILPLIVPLLG